MPVIIHVFAYVSFYRVRVYTILVTWLLCSLAIIVDTMHFIYCIAQLCRKGAFLWEYQPDFL